MTEPTVLIIGAGTFGTSTAYHLAQTYRDPSRVTIIDRESSPPAKAAAIDINRIIRADYPSTLYCNLANEAIHTWFWSNELGPCFHKVGWLRLNEQGQGPPSMRSPAVAFTAQTPRNTYDWAPCRIAKTLYWHTPIVPLDRLCGNGSNHLGRGECLPLLLGLAWYVHGLHVPHRLCSVARVRAGGRWK